MIVDIKYVNQPKEGKTFGSLRTPDGQMFFFKPNDFVIAPGKHEIETVARKWGENDVMLVTSVDGHSFETETKKSGKGGGKVFGDPKLAFTSQIVAAAIAANRVQNTEDLKKWAQFTYDLAGRLGKD